MTIGTSKLAQRVSEALAQDERTENATIEVIEADGIVTLRAEVASTTVHQAAESIARAREGVLDVVNELTVARDEGGEPIIDAMTINALASSGRKGYTPT